MYEMKCTKLNIESVYWKNQVISMQNYKLLVSSMNSIGFSGLFLFLLSLASLWGCLNLLVVHASDGRVPLVDFIPTTSEQQS